MQKSPPNLVKLEQKSLLTEIDQLFNIIQAPINPEPAASASFRSWLEMQNLRSHLWPTDSESSCSQDPHMIYMHIKVWRPLGQTRVSLFSFYTDVSTTSPESVFLGLEFFASFMDDSHVQSGSRTTGLQNVNLGWHSLKSQQCSQSDPKSQSECLTELGLDM